MHKISLLLFTMASIAILGLTGCGKKDEAGNGDNTAASGTAASAGACDRREKEKLCGEYHGKMAKTDWVKKECEAMGAPYVKACPKEDAVGRCVQGAGTAQETQTVYYVPMTKETVTTMCSGGEVREP